MVDVEGTVTFVNPKLAEIFGSTAENMLGKHVLQIVQDQDREKVERELKRLASGESTFYELSLGKPVKVISNPLFDSRGIFIGSLSVYIDLSEVNKLQELQSHFIASTNHEFRTPVTIIKGYIDFLLKRPELSRTKVDKIYSYLYGNITRLNRLIDNVLSYSTVMEEMFTIAPRETLLDDFVYKLMEDIRVTYPSRSIIINYDNSNDQYVFIDAERIEQIIYNLMSNAVKNSSKTSFIEVLFKRDERGLIVSVIDQGPGIPYHNLFQLFQPFSHFDTSFSTKGTGLGLFIVKILTLAHGGSIEVQSALERGTDFTIVIPG